MTSVGGHHDAHAIIAAFVGPFLIPRLLVVER
jgi:hypothetical protein